MCQCTPNARTPCCENCPYDLQVEWGLMPVRNKENKMTKKTKFIPFNYELYQKGAKAVFSNIPDYEIVSIIKSKYDHETLNLCIVYYNECDDLDNDYYNETGRDLSDKGHLMLELEIEEKVFWVNVYKNFHYSQTLIKYLSFEEAKKNRDEDSLGSLKIIYTEEDLIK